MTAWWQGAVGYQVYVRSFQDSNADGVGDLPGVRQRLPHIADIGADIVWLTPFYPSPQADHGYDVADYTGIDATFGDMADLDALVQEAHELGLRLIIDLVPNHTSDQHPWFQDAISSPNAAHRDFYVWRDGRPDGQPPNNWVSHFGGPAWSYEPAGGQWYMHLFLPEQPDLNWSNEAVRAAFDDVLRFWLERGVDGFRIDVAHSLVEDADFRDNPLATTSPEPAAGALTFDDFIHVHDVDQPGVLDVYRRWHRLAAEYDALLLGEVYLLDSERVARYVRDGDALHLAFCFPTLKVGWDADDIRTTLVGATGRGGDRFAWPLSSHDDPRAATRFGGGAVGARRALAYASLLCALPGVPVLYQGDELGLEDGVVHTHEDPIAVRNPGAKGRDGSRTPMLWEPGAGYGFTAGTPWLPFGDNHTASNSVAAQAGDPSSPLERIRAMLTARRQLPDLRDGPAPVWLTHLGPVVAFRRGRVLVTMHVGDEETSIEIGQLGVDGQPDSSGELDGIRIAHATADGARLEEGKLYLPADSAAWLTLSPDRHTEVVG